VANRAGARAVQTSEMRSVGLSVTPRRAMEKFCFFFEFF